MFVSFAGSWVTWLTIGPYVQRTLGTLVVFGVVALIRQLFTFFGTLAAEGAFRSWETRFANIWVQWVLIVLNFAAAMAYLFLPERVAYWVPVWAFARYWISGLSTVFGFRMLLRFSSKETSVTGQLALTQGTVVLGAIIAFGMSFLSPEQAPLLAIGVDVSAAFVLLYWLYRHFPADAKPINHFEKSQSRTHRILETVLALFKESSFRHGMSFILGLFSVSGLPSILLYISNAYPNPTAAFSLINIVLGTLLIVMTLLLNSVRRYEYLSGLAVILCLLAYILGAVDVRSIWFLPLFLLGSVVFLIDLHRRAMHEVSMQVAVKVRASMAVYLNLAFGVGDLMVSTLLADDRAFIVFALRILALVGALFFRWSS